MKPSWEDAPSWAMVLVEQKGFCGVLYCWAAAYENRAKAIWHDDLARSWMYFELKKDNWDFTEARP